MAEKIRESSQQKVFNILFAENTSTPDYDFLLKLVTDQFIEDGHLKRIPYEHIANIVFNTETIAYEENEYLHKNLTELIEVSNGNPVIGQFKEKVESHYRLSIEQKIYIKKNVRKLNEDIANAQTNIEASVELVNKTSDDTKEVSDDIVRTKNKMYTDFISILGIFSALIFGLFGGFSTFANWLHTIALDVSLTRLTFMSSILMIGLLTLMFLLLNGIANLSERNFKSCCREDTCTCPLSKKYPLYFYGTIVLLLLGLLSLIAMLLNHDGYLYDHPIQSIAGLLVFCLTTICIYKKIT